MKGLVEQQEARKGTLRGFSRPSNLPHTTQGPVRHASRQKFWGWETLGDDFL